MAILPPTLRAGALDLPVVPRWLYPAIIMFLGPLLAWAERCQATLDLCTS